MRGKALLVFLIFGSLTYAVYELHQKQPGLIGLLPIAVLGAVAAISLIMALFLRVGLNAAVRAGQRRRDRDQR